MRRTPPAFGANRLASRLVWRYNGPGFDSSMEGPMPRIASMIILTLGLGGFLASCVPVCEIASPNGLCAPETKIWHSSTGFTLTLSHKRYQYAPSLDELMDVCRNSLRVISGEIAAEKGKELIPYQAGDVMMKTARDDVLGVSTCNASVTVNYAVAG